jgi:hypothetical protein
MGGKHHEQQDVEVSMYLKTLFYTFFVKTKYIYIIILDIYDQNMMCVIASKGIRLCI